MECIFCKIIKGELSSYPIYEDDDFLVVLDIFPASKGHCLIISKKHDEIKGNLDKIIKKLVEKKEKLNFTTYVLLKKGEVEHFVLNFIPIYEGKELYYQVNNKEIDREELKKLQEMMKIEKEKKIIEIKKEEKKEKKEEIKKIKPWYVNP